MTGFVSKRVLKMAYIIWAFAGTLVAIQGNKTFLDVLDAVRR